MKTVPTVVMLSGSGRTLDNLLHHINEHGLPIRIIQVISSRTGVRGLEIAQQANIPTHVLRRKDFADLESFSEANFQICRQHHAGLVCLAGYLQLLKIPSDYHQKVVNIHPSLLPAFGGKGMYGHHVHEAVIASGIKVSGCTVHYVDDQFDHGPVIYQQTVPVEPGDSPELLADRVFAAECEAYPVALRQLVTELLSHE
ncbi:MAG: phosphoribosylglycinamide formyltransferase [Zavarzinella sp.]